MTRRAIKPSGFYDPHCAACIQTGKPVIATWIVHQGQGSRPLLACDKHRDQLETGGITALRKKTPDPA